MFSQRSAVRLILGLLSSMAVVSAAQVEASEPASCRMRSMRRSDRLARRAPTAPEDGVVTTEPSKESKQERDPEGGTSVPVTGDVRAVAQSSNQFAFELYKRPTEHDDNKFF